MILSALHHRSFALVWSGQTLSRTGDYVYQVALTWWVMEQTGSAAAVGTIATLALVPTILFLLVGGVLVDRSSPARVMLVSDAARGLLLAGVAVLAYQGRLALVHLYVASVIMGTVDAFFQPAYASVVPQLVPAQTLPSANALTSLSTQIGRILGPPAGAAVLALGGAAAVFGLDAASFFASGALLLALPRGAGRPPHEERPDGGALHALREGIAEVAGSPWLTTSLAVMAPANALLGAAYVVAIPFVVRGELRGGAGLLGAFYASFAVGYAAGAAWIARAGRLRGRGVKLYAALALGGVGMAAIGLPLPLPARIAAALVNGAALEACGVLWTTSMQEMVPADRLGRVASIDVLVSTALLPLGFAAASAAMNRLGAPMLCVIGGAGTVALAAAAMARPAVRGHD